MMRNDGGYGEIENEALISLLSSLDEHDMIEFEEYLKAKDEKAYHEFKEWQEKYWSDF